MAQFFKLPKNRRFSYKPRYYNEMAEKRKEREERIRKEVEAEKSGNYQSDASEELSNYITIARRTKKKSNIRLFVILVILLLIFYFFLLK